MNPTLRVASLARRGVLNLITKRPFCVSFEITHCCNAKCDHCHRGGNVPEQRATPERFAEVFRELKPLAIQISGGEPLLRQDVFDIIRSLRQPNGTPYIIFVTNGWLLTPEKFDRLCATGVDAYSISLDYPDERHDDHRNIKGLFAHLQKLTAELGRERAKAITLNCVVQSKNFREMLPLAKLARDWGVSINFSPYTWLRTQDKSYLIKKNEVPEFRTLCHELIAFKKRSNTVRTTDSFFEDMAQFFENESMPSCRAGERFLVVNPDATLSPCGLIITDYPNWEALKKGFTRTNTCTHCHTCIRSSTEKPLNNLVGGSIQSLLAVRVPPISLELR